MKFFLGAVIFFSWPLLGQAKVLKVATFNAGMLKVLRPVPFYKGRVSLLREEVKKKLREENFDVLSLQEIWTSKSIDALRAIHPEYELYVEEAGGWLPFLIYNRSGLAILAKKSLKGQFHLKMSKYGQRAVCLWGRICMKGHMHMSFEKEGQKILLVNSHLSSGYEGFMSRTAQVSELQLDAKHYLKKIRTDW